MNIVLAFGVFAIICFILALYTIVDYYKHEKREH